MAKVVRSKVAAGEYATESEVIRDGLRALLARDRAVESWLCEQIAPAYDAPGSDPSRAIGFDQLRASLVTKHRKGVEKGVMSYIVAFTPEAQEQLLELYRYIAAAASPVFAKTL